MFLKISFFIVSLLIYAETVAISVLVYKKLLIILLANASVTT